MPPTRSAAKPEQNLHEYCKSPQAGNPSDLWAFCLFSVLSASVFCPRAPVRCGWMFCRAWALQLASVHGCASSLALVRVPARSRGADRPWTPLRASAVRVSASPPARAQAVLSVLPELQSALLYGAQISLSPADTVHPARCKQKRPSRDQFSPHSGFQPERPQNHRLQEAIRLSDRHKGFRRP